MERAEDIVDFDAISGGFATIDLEGELGDIGAERGEDLGEFGMRFGFFDDGLGDVLEAGIIESAVSQFDLHLEAFGQAKSLDGWGKEDEAVGFLDASGGGDDGGIDGGEILGFATFF